VPVRLSLVAPEGAPAKSWRFPTTERLVRVVMGPIVEPRQGRLKSLQHKERLQY